MEESILFLRIALQLYIKIILENKKTRSLYHIKGREIAVPPLLANQII